MRILKPVCTYIFFTALTFLWACPLFSQVEFIENKGQWNSEVKFMSLAGSGSFYLQQNGFTIAQNNPKDLENSKMQHHHESLAIANVKITPVKVRAHAYSVKFLNSRVPQIIPDKAIPTINNYLIGDDKSKWATDCRIFKGVTYKNVYAGIDVRYYSDAGSNLKYDFIVHPGANVNDIAMKYTGADKIAVKNKELVISTSIGDNRELAPYTYQVVENKRQELECRYVVDGDVVKFKVRNYSPDKILIIDPTEIFFSYSGSTADNWGFTATYGPDGSFYGGGIAYGSGFPTSTGAYDNSFESKYDMSIIKLTPDGKSMVYATYIGGSAEDQPHSLIVDPQGNLVIAGRTKSPNYPTTNTYGKGGEWDIVITKLSASGNALIGSVKIGGTQNDGVNIGDESSVPSLNSLKRNYGDDSRSEVLLDASNNIYVASCTQSTDSLNLTNSFPTTAGAFQSKPGKKQDAVVIKLNPGCSNLLFSTYIGGKENDAAYVLKIGSNGNIYVAGGTASSDLPGISSSGVIQPAFAGGVCDGFVIELNSTGTQALKGTFLGTKSADQVYGIETDKLGFIYVTGLSEGDWTVVNAAYSDPGAKQFISKIKSDLSDYVYSTVFGSRNAKT
ncbi:MAG: SBBP repeat-containing protein, partial [Ginsengibacter sp.]